VNTQRGRCSIPGRGRFGGVGGALIGLGIPEYKAKRYEGMILSGNILLSVHCDNYDWALKARNFLEQNSAKDISTSGETTPPKKDSADRKPIQWL
jgi:hypothetical protein